MSVVAVFAVDEAQWGIGMAMRLDTEELRTEAFTGCGGTRPTKRKKIERCLGINHTREPTRSRA